MGEQMDIEKVIANIRNKESGSVGLSDDMDTLQFDKTELEDKIYKMSRTSQVPWYFEISGNPVSRAIKCLVRKSLVFFVYPISEGQNMYNSNTLDVIRLMQKYMETNQQVVNKMQEKIDCLEKELETLKSK